MTTGHRPLRPGHGMAVHTPKRVVKPHTVADIDFSEDMLICTCGESMSSTVEAWTKHRIVSGQTERSR